MLQRFTKTLTNFRARAPQFEGPQLRRHDACGFCGSFEAKLLSQADYWDLMQIDLVRCKSCGLMQVDPMLPPDVVSKGCLALYRFQQSGESDRSRKRGFYRAFRRGVAFGTSLKLKGIEPESVLEVGAGDGYFLKGLQYVFPNARFVCLDVIKEILDAMKAQHGFDTIHSSVENLDPSKLSKFDLIVARDILEHVADPGRVLEKISELLTRDGHLFFITPNGWQDAWQMFSRWQTDSIRSEILINHVNYFDAVSLRKKIESLGLKIEEWFIYDLKTFFRGAGWRLIEQHKARRSIRRSADAVIAESGALAETFREANRQPIPRVYSQSLIGLTLKPVLMFYCWFKHTSFVRVNADARVGEEIFCLARKVN